jgi:hypothetical protein
MAHYVASVNLFEYPTKTRVSVKVYRVFDYGARPRNPVLKRLVEVPVSPSQPPTEWLRQQLEALLPQL